MLQLYKSRDFGLFFKDTFAFLKMHGVHFFKNYLLVNGLFLAALIFMSYTLQTKLAEMQALGLLDEKNAEELLKYLKESISGNSGYITLYSLLFTFVLVLNYSFVPFYMKLYEKHKGANFSTKEIFNELTNNFGKLIKFFLATIVISIPLTIALSIVMGILAITFIGIPFILFVIALLILFYHSALLEYLKSDDKSVFDCYGYSLQLCFQQFIPSVGAVGIFILIAAIFQFTIGLVHGLILHYMGISVIDNPSYLTDLDKGSTLFMVAFAFQILTLLINYIITAALQIHLTIVYYGLKEDRENIHTQNSIETIGRD